MILSRSHLPSLVKIGTQSAAILSNTVFIWIRPINVDVPDAWNPGFGDFLTKSYYYYPKNIDHNSGDPVAISICQLSAHNGNRVTPSGAHLASFPPNLTIATEAAITELIFQGKEAIGVEAEGKQRKIIAIISNDLQEKG